VIFSVSPDLGRSSCTLPAIRSTSRSHPVTIQLAGIQPWTAGLSRRGLRNASRPTETRSSEGACNGGDSPWNSCLRPFCKREGTPVGYPDDCRENASECLDWHKPLTPFSDHCSGRGGSCRPTESGQVTSRP